MEQRGRAVDEVLDDELAARRSDDVAWADGRTFSLVYADLAAAVADAGRASDRTTTNATLE